jgi:LDH2 family malate/lactate/ureidoglycolate dehydrogenase
MTAIRRFAEAPLRVFGEAVLGSLGTPPETAAVVVETLIDADRRGVDTHGLVRLPSYCRQVADGEIRVDARPRIEREDGATALVDGGLAFGALVGTFAIDHAISRADRFGVGAVAARRCTHFGAAAYYALRAAEGGFIGVAATNTAGVMAPWGGAEPVVGNNPFAVAAPLPDGRPPFVLDMAQTAVSRGRVKLAEINREPLPEGWALDPEGRPTTDPTEALAGALLPFGGYKGYGLALAIEVLTGVVAGGGLSPELQNTSMTGAPRARAGASVGSVGNLYLALDPGRFVGRDEQRRRLARLVDGVKAARSAPGVDEVLVPGEPEARSAQAAAHEGIPLRESTVDALQHLAAERNLSFPEPRT